MTPILICSELKLIDCFLKDSDVTVTFFGSEIYHSKTLNVSINGYDLACKVSKIAVNYFDINEPQSNRGKFTKEEKLLSNSIRTSLSRLSDKEDELYKKVCFITKIFHAIRGTLRFDGTCLEQLPIFIDSELHDD